MAIDRGVIDKQLLALGEGHRWWQQRELRDLPAILQADEQILTLARGKIGRPRWMRRSWLIVATDRRLLCLRSARDARWTQLEVNGNLITRVSLRIGPMRGRVLVVAAGQTYRLLVQRPQAYRLFNSLTGFVPVTAETHAGFRPTLMARRVIDHVLALPAAALKPDGSPPPPPRELVTPAVTDEHVHSLEEQVDELRNQVQFLEQLLHNQQAEADHSPAYDPPRVRS